MPRSIKRTVDSAGTFDYSPWARVNSGLEDYNIGFTTRPHSGTTGTYSIQETLGNPEETVKARFSRTTTTLTITLADHGLAALDGVLLQGTPWDATGGFSLEVATVTDANIFTVTVLNIGPASGGLNISTLPINDFSSFSAVSGIQTGRTQGAVQMIRLATGAGSLSGKVTIHVTQSYGS